MRTANQFQTEVVKMMRDSVKRVTALREDYEKFRACSTDTRKYGPDSIKAFREEADKTYREIVNTMIAVNTEAKKMCDAYSVEIEAADALNPAEMTDDVKLLNCGVALSENDLRQIATRNQSNSTMCKLVMRYAQQHNMNIGMQYVGFTAERDAVSNLRAVTDTLFQPEKYTYIEKTFDRVFGAE